MRAIFLVATFAMFASASAAEEPHDTIRDSLVFIKATGISLSQGNGGNQVEAAATGFLISDDGMIVTNYHLLEQLGAVAPNSVRFEISVKERTADRRPAAAVDGSELLDLLILKTPPPPDPFTPVVLGSAFEHPDGEEIFTSGFPGTVSYRKVKGEIEAREGPGGVVWTTSLATPAGQSGGPIYDQLARVIGVVKGDDPSSSYMIPIDFADGLIAQVRIRELRNRIETLESRFRLAEMPNAVKTWKAGREDVDLGVLEGDGFCYLSKVWGDFDDPEDSVGVVIVNKRYVLTGNEKGGSSHGAHPVCLLTNGR